MHPDRLGKLLGVLAVQLHQFLERLGLFQRLEILPQAIIDQLLFQNLRLRQGLFVEIAVNGRQSGPLPKGLMMSR
jgi:hypothetical protein